MKITVETLRKLNACRPQVDLFVDTFPDGVEVTAETITAARRANLDVEWLLQFASAPALAEYNKVRIAALAEYNKVRDAALAEYRKVTAPALAEYNKVRIAALAEYYKVGNAAKAEYRKVTAPALAEYNKVRNAALAECLNNSNF